MMNELLVETTWGNESLNDFQPIKELHQTTETMLGRVTDEIVLGGFVSALTAVCMQSC